MHAEHFHPCPRCTGQEACTSSCPIRADISGDDGFFGDPRRCSLCKKAGRSCSAPEVAAAAGLSSAEVLAAAKRGDVDLGSLSSVSRFIEQRRAGTQGYADTGYRAAIRELRLAGCCAQDLGFGLFLWAPIYKEGKLLTFSQWAKENPEQAVPVPSHAAYEAIKGPHAPCCGCVCGGCRCPGEPAYPCMDGCIDDMVRRRYAMVVHGKAALPRYSFAGELAGPIAEAVRKHPRKPLLPLPPFSGLMSRLADRCERGQGYDEEAVRMRKQLGESIGFDDPVLARLQVRAARRKA